MMNKIGQLAGGLLILGVCSCNKNTTPEYPNRSLDRPTDLALTCVSLNCDGAQTKEECRVQNHSLSDCWNSASSSTKCEVSSPQSWPSEAMHLVGFVANSERNEVAMFTECSGRLVDMAPDVPGYNFIPVGSLPVGLTSDAGCRVISANSGSCDLSVLDAANLAGYGFGVRSPNSDDTFRVGGAGVWSEPEEREMSSQLDRRGSRQSDGASSELNPSALVANIRPSRFDVQSGQWLPLGVSPALVLATPQTLSQGSSGEQTLECRLNRRGSAYVAFPACDLVAEIDLVSGRIVQSKQFLRGASGDIEVIDTGASPICPQIDCPNQFQGLPTPQKSESEQGLAPGALELIVPKKCDNQSVACTAPSNPDETEQTEGENLALCCDDGDRAIAEPVLLVGGMNSDELFEIKFEENGSWKPEVNRLELVGSHGISRIRATPGMRIEDGGGTSLIPGHGDGAGNYQFIYAIAGDGSTRVVSRLLGDPNRTEIGIECDSQIDSVHADFSRICEPALDGSSFDAPLERRALAVGPGIRAPRNARILDWSFVKRIQPGASRSELFQVPGVIGVGTTSVGRVVYATFGQYLDRQNVGIGVEPTLATDGFDRAGTMRVQLPAHSLHAFAALAPVRDDRLGLPLVRDAEPEVTRPGRIDPTARLSPALRLLDAAYLEQSDKQPSGYYQLLAGAGAKLTNADALGGENNEGALYEDNAPKVFTRDYRSWEASDWTLEWEGVVPGTLSSNGRFWCNQPPEHEGSVGCQPQAEGDSRLLDESTNFCAAGVIRGDKLRIPGCRRDDDCGVGQKCLLETANGGVGTGICISAQAYDQDAARLRKVCRHFIQDPCGEPHREYLITRAYEHELFLQELDLPKISHIPDEDSCPEGGKNNHLEAGVCVCDEGFEWCPTGVGHALDCCSIVGAEWEEGWPVLHVEEQVDRFVCREENPDGGCVIDADCESLLDEPSGSPSDQTVAGIKLMSSLCIAGKCRRPCVTVAEANEANAANTGVPGADIIAPDRCSVRQLPAQECFQELVRYEIRARNSFLVRGSLPGAGFFSDRVQTADDGECVRVGTDANVSNLKTSRIPLGSDLENLGLEICPTDFEEANAYTPNPCVIPTLRSGTTNTEGATLEPPSKYHYFAYRGRPVAAIRYSNPVFSFILDLVNLESLISSLPGGSKGEYWPASFANYHRSRIPRGYQLRFGIEQGYEAMNLSVIPPTSSFGQLTMPLRIINSPTPYTVFVVDGSGPGTGSAIRGQVLKIPLTANFDTSLQADTRFDGVR